MRAATEGTKPMRVGAGAASEGSGTRTDADEQGDGLAGEVAMPAVHRSP